MKDYSRITLFGSRLLVLKPWQGDTNKNYTGLFNN